jgi:hypothetical protein
MRKTFRYLARTLHPVCGPEIRYHSAMRPFYGVSFQDRVYFFGVFEDVLIV